MILLNGTPINRTTFPDRTSQVWKIGNLQDQNHVVWWFEDETEIMALLQLSTLIWSLPCHASSLFMPFLPYGRQDKPVANDATFALRSFADVVNMMQFDEVSSLDVHSDVAEELIERFRNVPPNLSDLTENYDYICVPDTGALHRYCDRYRIVDAKRSLVGHKVRDPQTGWITSYQLANLPDDLNGARVLVLDDICDGGATFQILARSLREIATPSRLDLYVTHGLFSRGLGKLLGLDANTPAAYDHVITTDSVFGYHAVSGGSSPTRFPEAWWNQLMACVDQGRLFIRKIACTT